MGILGLAVLVKGGFPLQWTALFPALVAAAGSLVGGLVGWLLLSCRRVWYCRRCGYFLERS